MPQAQAGPSAAAAAVGQPQEAFDLDEELTALEADTKVGFSGILGLQWFHHASSGPLLPFPWSGAISCA